MRTHPRSAWLPPRTDYSVYFPETAEAFMYNVTDGQSYRVVCNGMSATTTVRTRK